MLCVKFGKEELKIIMKIVSSAIFRYESVVHHYYVYESEVDDSDTDYVGNIVEQLVKHGFVSSDKKEELYSRLSEEFGDIIDECSSCGREIAYYIVRTVLCEMKNR